MKRANDFIVGLVIVVGIAIVVGATLWAKQSEIGDRRERVTARFRDVGNVRVGAAVVIRGVRAGRIEAIELSPGGWVDVRMSLDHDARLPNDPVVLLNEASLFGEWQATVTERSAVPRDEAVSRQLDLARGAGDGTIPGATLPDIAQLTAVAGRIAGDVASVAERFEVAFDDVAAKELRSSIRNFAQLSGALAQTVRAQSRNLDALAVDMRSGMQSLARSAETVSSVASRVDSSTSTGEIKQIVHDVAIAAAQLKETSAELRTMSRQLARSQGGLESVLSSTDSVMRKINAGHGSLGLLVNDPSLYNNSDSLVMQMRSVLADLQSNPRKYVNLKVF